MSRDPVVPPLEELPEDAQRLLVVARKGMEVPAEVRSRLYASVVSAGPTGGGGGSDGGGATGGGGGVETSAGLGHALSGLVQGKAVAGLVGAAVGAGMMFGWQQLAPLPESPGVVVTSSAPVQVPPRPDDEVVPAASASSAPAPTASDAPPSASVVSAGPRPAVASAPAPPEASRDKLLRRERALIDGARMAVARRQGDAALRLLSQHASEFPGGELREEREGLMAHALALSGKKREAEDQAARYKDEFPNGLMSDSMDKVLEEPGPDR